MNKTVSFEEHDLEDSALQTWILQRCRHSIDHEIKNAVQVLHSGLELPETRMRIRSFALLLIAVAHTAAAQDDYKVIKLEQDVRNLERQVQDLSRQLADTQRQLALIGGRPAARSNRAEPAAAQTTAWLDVSNWDKLREGMTELQVIALLGPPTSTRAEGESRVLFYAMEIGTNAFLGGSVRLENRKVEDVAKPVLR